MARPQRLASEHNPIKQPDGIARDLRVRVHAKGKSLVPAVGVEWQADFGRASEAEELLEMGGGDGGADVAEVDLVDTCRPPGLGEGVRWSIATRNLCRRLVVVALVLLLLLTNRRSQALEESGRHLGWLTFAAASPLPRGWVRRGRLRLLLECSGRLLLRYQWRVVRCQG